jgi:hypothetical protein
LSAYFRLRVRARSNFWRLLTWHLGHVPLVKAEYRSRNLLHRRQTLATFRAKRRSDKWHRRMVVKWPVAHDRTCHRHAWRACARIPQCA